MERCFIFDEVQPFYKDLATVKLDSHWGVINKSGEWVIKPHYQKLVLLYELRRYFTDFSGGSDTFARMGREKS